uniref:Uncharacterized protein n=1 Tax=Globodera rostochiensis TaxID=31243 RepID=A0A914HW08_GLORO
MYVFLAKKFQFQTSGCTNFTSIAWMPNRCYLAVGGNDGTLRLILFKLDQANVRQDTLASEQNANWDNVPEGRPRFLIAYQNGNIQLMCSENVSKSARIVRLNSTLIICAQWSPDGSMFAVAGHQLDLPETERNVMHFMSAYGDVWKETPPPTALTNSTRFGNTNLADGLNI